MLSQTESVHMMEAGESQVFISSKMKESSHILQVRRNIQEGGCVWNSDSEPGMTSVLIYKSYFHI